MNETDPIFSRLSAALCAWAKAADSTLDKVDVFTKPSRRLQRLRESARKYSDVWGSDPSGWLVMMTRARLRAAVQHAQAISSLLTTDLSAPIAALARACSEVSARAYWLIQPRRSTNELLARMLAETCHDALEAERLLPTMATQSQDQRHRAGAMGQRLGLEVRFDPRGVPKHIGDPRPSNVALISQASPAHLRSDAPYYYRFSSWSLHGSTWAVPMFGPPLPLIHDAVGMTHRAIDAWTGLWAWPAEGEAISRLWHSWETYADAWVRAAEATQ